MRDSLNKADDTWFRVRYQVIVVVMQLYGMQWIRAYARLTGNIPKLTELLTLNRIIHSDEVQRLHARFLLGISG